jgi:hypothetical protein
MSLFVCLNRAPSLEAECCFRLSILGLFKDLALAAPIVCGATRVSRTQLYTRVSFLQTDTSIDPSFGVQCVVYSLSVHSIANKTLPLRQRAKTRTHRLAEATCRRRLPSHGQRRVSARQNSQNER